MEIWKDILLEPSYQVSNIGRVRRKNTNRVLSNVINNKRKPYYRIGLMNKGKRNFYLVHRLVAIAFIPNPENKPHINHINEIKNDNRVDNLQWVTNKENKRYSTARKIIQIQKGVIVKEWASLAEIKDTGLFSISKISDCCHGKRNKHKNFNWSFCV